MSSSEIAGSKTDRGGKKLENVNHRRNRSAADDLFDLTENLSRLQGKHYNIEDRAESNDTVSSADSLAKNAKKLLTRRNAQKYVENKDQMEKIALNQGSTKSKTKWNTVQAAVTADRLNDNATNASPITDETKENIVDEERGEAVDKTDEGINHSTSRREKKTLSRKVAVQSNELFQDFTSWLSYKKDGIITHVKLMIFLIIPAIGVAAL